MNAFRVIERLQRMKNKETLKTTNFQSVIMSFFVCCSNRFAQNYELSVFYADQEDVEEIVNELKNEEIFPKLKFEMLGQIGIDFERRMNEIYKPSDEHNLNCPNHFCSTNANIGFY